MHSLTLTRTSSRASRPCIVFNGARRRRSSVASHLPRMRLVAFNDVYDLHNLPRIQTYLTGLSHDARPSAVLLAGDFLSPSTLSALDGGKGMVATLRAIGVTHGILGNHEADLKWNQLQKRLQKLRQSVTLINSNVGPYDDQAPWLCNLFTPVSQLPTPCGRVKVGLIGLMSDEPDMFRDHTFRGAPIANVIDTYQSLVQSKDVDMVIPLTHQSLSRDLELATSMLQHGNGLIVGGHEHTPQDETVSDENHSVRILKAGTQGETLSVIDLVFDKDGSDENFRLVDLDYELVDVTGLAASVPVQKIVDSHMMLLHSLDNEDIVHADNLLPPGIPLSSELTRYRQTTVGGVLCQAIKDELEADVCVINGATIKGDSTYPHPNMTYSQLKQELPFPTKMVVVPMKRWELQEAIHYSRTQPSPGADAIPRKGYLQVDVEFDRLGFHTGRQDDVLQVALPRNLMKGFCKIQPLMDLGAKLEAQGIFPSDDDFVPAIDIVTRHFCKEMWYEIVHESYSFDDLDEDHKGFLSREDVRRMLHKAIGHDPADFVVNDMIDAVDADQNGVIDPGEFSHLLAEVERQHGMIQFDNSL